MCSDVLHLNPSVWPWHKLCSAFTMTGVKNLVMNLLDKEVLSKLTWSQLCLWRCNFDYGLPFALCARTSRTDVSSDQDFLLSFPEALDDSRSLLHLHLPAEQRHLVALPWQLPRQPACRLPRLAHTHTKQRGSTAILHPLDRGINTCIFYPMRDTCRRADTQGILFWGEVELRKAHTSKYDT